MSTVMAPSLSVFYALHFTNVTSVTHKNLKKKILRLTAQKEKQKPGWEGQVSWPQSQNEQTAQA